MVQNLKAFFYGIYQSFAGSVDIIILMIIGGLLGLLIFLSLKFVNQRWVNTYHHLMTYILLPIIALIITRLISGNIALSLGMIGALSIIRFRNPVKNPLELVMFFGLLTIGIGLSVKVILGVFLSFGICVALIVVDKFNLYLKKNGKGLFSISFDDGILNNVIEISSSTSIQSLFENELLTQYYYDNNTKKYNYKLSSNIKKDIQNIEKDCKHKESIISIDITYA